MFFCFWGHWALFRGFTKAFAKTFPKYEIAAFIATFCVPSVVFWCGGILKDTIIISAVGVAFYCFYSLFFEKRRIVFCSIMLLISILVMNIVKFYVALALTPAFLLCLVHSFFKKFKNPYLRTLMILSVGGGGLVIVMLALQVFGGPINGFTNQLIKRAIATQTWHALIQDVGGGSGYDLGVIDISFWGILSKIPASLNVTFFRPYLWEVSSVVVLIAALESLLATFLTIYTVFKAGLIKAFSLVFQHSILFFFFTFNALFGFLVGFTSYNFGIYFFNHVKINTKFLSIACLKI